MTLTFLCLILVELLKSYNFRSDRNSAFKKPFTNKWLNIAILWELSLMMLIVYVPFLQKLIGTYSLSIAD